MCSLRWLGLTPALFSITYGVRVVSTESMDLTVDTVTSSSSSSAASIKTILDTDIDRVRLNIRPRLKRAKGKTRSRNLSRLNMDSPTGVLDEWQDPDIIAELSARTAALSISQHGAVRRLSTTSDVGVNLQIDSGETIGALDFINRIENFLVPLNSVLKAMLNCL